MGALLRTGVLAILDLGIHGPEMRLVRLARNLRRAGIRFFQLRAKSAEDAVTLRIAGALKAALPGCVLTINDRCDISLVARLDGVHLGVDDLPFAAARKLLGPRKVIGVSAGNRYEVRGMAAVRPDYISIGPVHATGTKPDAGKPLEVSGFVSLARMTASPIPRVAVGGINPDNAYTLIKSGADAVAVASWWLKISDPARAAKQMLEAVKEAGRAGPPVGQKNGTLEDCSW